MNDENIIDGGSPAVEPAPETVTEPVEPVEQTPEQIEEQKQAEEERKRKTGSQRAREKAERLERENQALRDALARTHSVKAPEPEEPAYVPKTADGRPDPEDPKFKTYEDYLDALTDWKVGQKLQAAEAQKTALEREGVFRSQMQAAHQAHPDLADLLDDLAEAGVPPPTETMHRVITASESGSELLYHLAQNPSEIRRIGALPPIAQALEMGVLLGQLRTRDSRPKPEPKPSNAPPPPRPVKATGVASVDESKLSDADWLKSQRGKR